MFLDKCPILTICLSDEDTEGFLLTKLPSVIFEDKKHSVVSLVGGTAAIEFVLMREGFSGKGYSGFSGCLNIGSCHHRHTPLFENIDDCGEWEIR